MAAKLSGILEELAGLSERELRADLLIEFAENFQQAPESITGKRLSGCSQQAYPPQHKVPGCESDAYIWVTRDEAGLLTPHFVVLNPQGISAKALAAIITEGLTKMPAAAYVELQDTMVDAVFGRTISMGKGQGLMGMVRLVKFLAQQAS